MTSDDGNFVCELKPVNRKKGVERITKLFEFLMRNIVDECVKTKIESQWAKAVPLKDTPTHLKEGRLVAVSYNRSVKIRKIWYYLEIRHYISFGVLWCDKTAGIRL